VRPVEVTVVIVVVGLKLVAGRWLVNRSAILRLVRAGCLVVCVNAVVLIVRRIAENPVRERRIGDRLPVGRDGEVVSKEDGNVPVV
jgi:hypothetical protein